MKRSLKYMLVPENFVRIIKINSAIEGKTIIQYTEEMGKAMEEKFNNQQTQRRSFDFNLTK